MKVQRNGAADVRICADPDELAARAADAAAAAINEVVAAEGRCSVVLSGGSTPRGFHRMLMLRGDAIPWEQVHLFWSDERYVPADDPRSNYGMAKETLLDHVPCPPSNMHPMPTASLEPPEAARRYERSIREYFAGGPVRFDLAVLGIGADGHTASLFPGSRALLERTRLVLAVTTDAEPPTRLTLTLPVLTSCARVWFLATGAEKAAAVRTAIESGDASPAGVVSAAADDVVWWLDRDAAADPGARRNSGGLNEM